jgi:hypothetical protein
MELLETRDQVYGRIHRDVQPETEEFGVLYSRNTAVMDWQGLSSALERNVVAERNASVGAGFLTGVSLVRKLSGVEQVSEFWFFLGSLIAFNTTNDLGSGPFVASPAVYFYPLSFFQIFVVSKEMFDL